MPYHLFVNDNEMAQRIIDRSYVGEVLQHIYTSNLDITIALVSKDGYYHIGLDNEKHVSLSGTSIEEVVTHLALRLSKQYPASAFASWWITNFREEDFSR